jgi:hypothetical protein
VQAAACAFSRGSLLPRLASSIAAGILAYCFLRLFFEDRDFGEFGVDLAGQWVLVAAVCHLLRWRGFELRRVSALPHEAGPAGSQFSLGRLLLFTSTCAVMLGIGSQMRLPSRPDLIFTTVVVIGFTCATLLPLVACLAVRQVSFYAAVATVVLGGLVAVFARVGRRFSVFELILMMTIFLWPSALVAIAGLRLRRRQWRLTRRRAARMVQESAATSPIQPAQL